MNIYTNLKNFYEKKYAEITEYHLFATFDEIQRCAGACEFAAQLASDKKEKQAIIELWDSDWRCKFLGVIKLWDLI